MRDGALDAAAVLKVSLEVMVVYSALISNPRINPSPILVVR